MKKVILILALMTSSAFAKDTCRNLLENMARAAFDATEFREPLFDINTKIVSMTPRKKKIEVLVLQHSAIFKVRFKLKNGDTKRCEIESMSEFEELPL